MLALNTVLESKILTTSFSLLSFRYFFFKELFSKIYASDSASSYMLHNDFSLLILIIINKKYCKMLSYSYDIQ